MAVIERKFWLLGRRILLPAAVMRSETECIVCTVHPQGQKSLLFWSGSPYINPYNNQRGRCSVIIIIIIIIIITYMTLQLHQESITSQKIRQWIRMIQFIWTAQLRAFPNQTSLGPDSLTTGLWPCRWISQDERTKVATDAQLIMVLVIETPLMSS